MDKHLGTKNYCRIDDLDECTPPTSKNGAGPIGTVDKDHRSRSFATWWQHTNEMTSGGPRTSAYAWDRPL